jgi:hypothetical protein
MPAHGRPFCIAQTALRVPTCVGTEITANRGRRSGPLAGSVRRGCQARWCLLHPTPPRLSWAHDGARHAIAAPCSLSTTAPGARQVPLHWRTRPSPCPCTRCRSRARSLHRRKARRRPRQCRHDRAGCAAAGQAARPARGSLNCGNPLRVVAAGACTLTSLALRTVGR